MAKRKIRKDTKKYLKKLEKREKNKKDKEWHDAIKKRDNNICVICLSNKFINTHHIIPKENQNFRWDADNGVCLCVKHHKYNLEISAHRNSLAFILWLQENRKEQLDRLLLKYKERIEK